MDTLFTPCLIWFLLGIGLALLELLVPGFVLLFFGIGCWVVSGTLLLWDLSLTHQVLIFLVGTISSLLVLRKYLMRTFRGLTRDGDKDFDDFPHGVLVKVIRRISPTVHGRIQFRGTAWDAAADEEIDEGDMVEVVRYWNDNRQIFFVKRP